MSKDRTGRGIVLINLIIIYENYREKQNYVYGDPIYQVALSVFISHTCIYSQACFSDHLYYAITCNM
jgi:hypothetical protein